MSFSIKPDIRQTILGQITEDLFAAGTPAQVRPLVPNKFLASLANHRLYFYMFAVVGIFIIASNTWRLPDNLAYIIFMYSVFPALGFLFFACELTRFDRRILVKLLLSFDFLLLVASMCVFVAISQYQSFQVTTTSLNYRIGECVRDVCSYVVIVMVNLCSDAAPTLDFRIKTTFFALLFLNSLRILLREFFSIGGKAQVSQEQFLFTNIRRLYMSSLSPLTIYFVKLFLAHLIRSYKSIQAGNQNVVFGMVDLPFERGELSEALCVDCPIPRKQAQIAPAPVPTQSTDIPPSPTPTPTPTPSSSSSSSSSSSAAPALSVTASPTASPPTPSFPSPSSSLLFSHTIAVDHANMMIRLPLTVADQHLIIPSRRSRARALVPASASSQAPPPPAAEKTDGTVEGAGGASQNTPTPTPTPSSTEMASKNVTITNVAVQPANWSTLPSSSEVWSLSSSAMQTQVSPLFNHPLIRLPSTPSPFDDDESFDGLGDSADPNKVRRQRSDMSMFASQQRGGGGGAGGAHEKARTPQESQENRYEKSEPPHQQAEVKSQDKLPDQASAPSQDQASEKMGEEKGPEKKLATHLVGINVISPPDEAIPDDVHDGFSTARLDQLALPSHPLSQYQAPLSPHSSQPLLSPHSPHSLHSPHSTDSTHSSQTPLSSPHSSSQLQQPVSPLSQPLIQVDSGNALSGDKEAMARAHHRRISSTGAVAALVAAVRRRAPRGSLLTSLGLNTSLVLEYSICIGQPFIHGGLVGRAYKWLVQLINHPIYTGFVMAYFICAALIMYLRVLTAWYQLALLLLLALFILITVLSRSYVFLVRHLWYSFDYWYIGGNVALYLVMNVIGDLSSGADMPNRFLYYAVFGLCNMFVIHSDAFCLERRGLMRVWNLGFLSLLLVDVVLSLLNRYTGVGIQTTVTVCYSYCFNTADFAVTALLNLILFYLRFLTNAIYNPDMFFLLNCPIEYSVTH